MTTDTNGFKTKTGANAMLLNSSAQSSLPLFDSPKIKTLTNSELIDKYGYSRSKIITSMTSHFYMPAKIKLAMSNYFILYYTGTYFAKRLAEDKIATISVHGINGDTNYNVVYDSCTPEQCKNAEQVVLSFRNASQAIGITNAYVMVRLAKKSIISSSESP